MTSELIIDVILRWMHILAAITLVGGVIFSRFVLFPAIEALPESQRGEIQEGTRRRWSRLVMIATVVLLASGIANFVRIVGTYELKGALYQPLFGVKFLLAMSIFYFTAALSGRSKSAQSFRQNWRLWLSVNLALVILLVAISGVLKNTPRAKKTDKISAQAAQPE